MRNFNRKIGFLNEIIKEMKMRKNILIWVACTVAAFGLNGCASDDAPEKSEERNTEGLSFEIPAESQAD